MVLVPIDRATIGAGVERGGYPAHGRYRDYHRHTIHHHQPWANDGGAYDHERALRARAARTPRTSWPAPRERLRRDGAGLPGGGLVVCALDTELLGHWWYEGLAWLAAVVEECARQGLPLVRLDDALERQPSRCGSCRPPRTRLRQEWEVSTWGAGGDLSTWSGPAVAELAFATRAAELEVVRAGTRAGAAAVRELLALQASDWAFMVSRGLAVPYARERFAAHRPGVAAGAGGRRRRRRGGCATSRCMPIALRCWRLMRALRPADHGRYWPADHAGAAGPADPGRCWPPDPCGLLACCSLPAQRTGRLAHADHARGDAADDGVGGAPPW